MENLKDLKAYLDNVHKLGRSISVGSIQTGMIISFAYIFQYEKQIQDFYDSFPLGIVLRGKTKAKNGNYYLTMGSFHQMPVKARQWILKKIASNNKNIPDDYESLLMLSQSAKKIIRNYDLIGIKRVYMFDNLEHVNYLAKWTANSYQKSYNAMVKHFKES